jgi:hydrogenase maturation protein HypF
MEIHVSSNIKKNILSLGAESAGNFSVFTKNKIYFSQEFGDLLIEKNFQRFQNSILEYLIQNKIKPEIILTDLHPLYKNTFLGEKLSKKFKAEIIKIQHHLAHIFSAIGEKILIKNKAKKLNKNLDIIGIASDGTGYGLDGKIWGGEVFRIKIKNSKANIERIGHLENQILIGGEMAIKEPARMILAILSKIKEKKEIYLFLKKHYSKNQFEALFNQLKQKFNCFESSSTGRVLDAVSVLLGFSKNQRAYKHEPIENLEKNSTQPYKITPKIKIQNSKIILLTTPLFQYLIENFEKNKNRLAATSQLYIAKGFYQIVIKYFQKNKIKKSTFNENYFFAGGVANNKIISAYLESKGFYVNKIIPRGDGSISFGQCLYYMLTNPRN